MRKLFLKSLNVITIVTHPGIPKKYCFFIRDNYFSRLIQIKYYLKDYYLKKIYKVIEYHGEFQQELTFVLPFAYWHFLNGTLDKTISSDNTKELYFFSDKHEESETKRDWLFNDETFEIPNMTHSNTFSYKKWKRVPLQPYYKNEIFVFEKPILIIANKYNIEWKNDPVNFFDITMLDRIFRCYKDKYQVIYNRPLSTQIVSDNSEILDLGEYSWIKANHPDVLLMDDLFTKNQKYVNNFNHLQLMVYANCSHFISVHGGTAALASYFGGTNIIFSKRGLEHVFNEFSTIFPKLSGAKILHAEKEEDVFNYLQQYY
ncbi:MAG: hypothetical protein ABIO81_01960 [Ginsengibacter sp.]